jgi:hypothetical protein
VRGVGPARESGIDRDGDQHPAGCGQQRGSGAARVPKLANVELTPHLEARAF